MPMHPSPAVRHTSTLVLLKLPGVSTRKINGLDAYFVSDKMFACISGHGVGLRLPAATANELQFSRDNVVPFQPGGMASSREWIQINVPTRPSTEKDSPAIPGFARVCESRPNALGRRGIREEGETETMNLCDSLRMMPGTTIGMNEKLYAVCAQAPTKTAGATARLSSDRFTHAEPPAPHRPWLAGAFQRKAVDVRSLDQELYADFHELRREAHQRPIVRSRSSSSESRQSASMRRSVTKIMREQIYSPTGPALVHLFNHQTHHRGQLTTLLSQLGIDPGVTDAMAFYREHVLR